HSGRYGPASPSPRCPAVRRGATLGAADGMWSNASEGRGRGSAGEGPAEMTRRPPIPWRAPRVSVAAAFGGPTPLPSLLQGRPDDLGEARPRPVQARLHGAEVAVRDFRDFLVRTAFQLAEDEYLAVMLRQTGHRIFHQLADVALPVQLVRLHRGILELERTLLVFPALRHRLEEHQRIARAVSQLVLRQVR